MVKLLTSLLFLVGTYAYSYELGLILEPTMLRSFGPVYEDGLPASSSLMGYTSNIKDQGACGSCVAFAVAGLFETQFNIFTGLPIYNLDMSEQHLFSCGGGMCSKGWRFTPALEYMVKNGIPDELCQKYQAKDVQCSTSCSDWERRSIKFASYLEIPFSEFPTWISGNFVVLTGMAVYADFMKYTGGIYKTDGKTFKGYHAVLVVGYDLKERYFLVRNSWGEDWGEKGYFRISMDDSKSLIMDGYVVRIQ